MSRKLVLALGLLPKKRTAAETNDDDEQTNEDSDALFLKEDNAKRARLDSFSDTTLQDLPNEILECILVKAVAMKVKDLKLIKSVWKDKADLVINRLKSVSSHWTSILSTNVFRNEVYRLLDGTAQEKIRLEVLHESSAPYTQLYVNFITSLKDEIFMLERRNQYVVIRVYNRDNMAKMTGVVALQAERGVMCMTACNVSNCIYVGLHNGGNTLSVIRISRVGDQFNVSPWINDHKLKIYLMNVCNNGNLLLLSLLNGTLPNPCLLSMYNANGFLQHEIILPQDIHVLHCRIAFQKSNGNWIIVYESRQNGHTNLKEIDASGSVVRRYESSFIYCCANFADIHGRIMITNKSFGNMELLDSEFNLLGNYSLQQDEGKLPYVYAIHYVSETDEILRAQSKYCNSSNHYGLTIFRFTEE